MINKLLEKYKDKLPPQLTKLLGKKNIDHDAGDEESDLDQVESKSIVVKIKNAINKFKQKKSKAEPASTKKKVSKKSVQSSEDKTDPNIHVDMQELDSEIEKLEREIEGDAEDSDQALLGEVETDEDDLDQEESAEDLKKKKQKKMIYAVVVAGLVYLVVDEMFLKEQVIEVPEVAPVARPKPKTAEPAAPVPEVTKEEAKSTPPEPPPTSTSTVENQSNQADGKLEEGEATPEPAAPVAQTQESEEAEAESESEEGEAVPAPAPAVPVASDDEGEQSSEDDTTESSEGELAQGSTEDLAQGDVDTDLSDATGAGSSGQDPITEDILKNLEKQIASRTQKREENVLLQKATEYNNPGRGLVYSCKGKHWACVDAANFSRCENNFKYYKLNKQKPDCFPENVYMTDKDCSFAQQRMINLSIDTKFCD